MNRGFGLVIALWLVGAGANAQSLPGLWGSTEYRLQLAVSGTAITGSFTPADNPQAPAGTIQGQLQPGGQAFTAVWTQPLAQDPGAFHTWLKLAGKGALLAGYRWSDETREPTSFALHRAIGGVVPIPVGQDDGGVTSATNPQATVLFDNGNLARVSNGPTTAVRVQLTTACRITALETYHWNNGDGAPPGRIGFKSASGQLRYEWPTTGLEGMGGRKNCIWHADVDVTLPAGTYLVTDSDTKTWSQNQQSAGRGFAKIWGAPVSGTTTPNTSNSDTSIPVQRGPLVVCTAVVNNQPVSPGTQFTNLPRVYCWLPYEGLATGLTVTCEWLRGGQSFVTSKTTLSGAKGWMWFSLSANGEVLTKGNYTVRVSTSSRTLGQQDFIVN